MSLIKYNTNQYRPLAFNNLFDGFFNEHFADSKVRNNKSFAPQVDISETEKAFELQFLVPGMDKKSFAIDLQDGKLTVSGERKIKDENNEKNFHSVESFHGSFSRLFYLPDNIDGGKVEANYVDGILAITIPKDEKKVVKTSIVVK